jgi:hypothetical protein
MSTVAADLAAKHIEAAITLMGREWVTQRLQQQQQPVAGAATRGRKAGVIPSDERRCAWQPTGRDRCKNSHSDQGMYCKIHTVQIPLLDQ